MAVYLLDTNIMSDLIKHPQGTVMKHIERVGEDNIVTSIIVAAELRYGAEKKASQRLTERVDAILSRIDILPIATDIDRTYGTIRVDLEQKGTPIGANDLLIAAQVSNLNEEQHCILVTANTREFERVENLNLENWLSLDS